MMTRIAISPAQTAGPGRMRSLAIPTHRPGIEILVVNQTNPKAAASVKITPGIKACRAVR